MFSPFLRICREAWTVEISIEYCLLLTRLLNLSASMVLTLSLVRRCIAIHFHALVTTNGLDTCRCSSCTAVHSNMEDLWLRPYKLRRATKLLARTTWILTYILWIREERSQQFGVASSCRNIQAGGKLNPDLLAWNGTLRSSPRRSHVR